jgi:hypothetical protein
MISSRNLCRNSNSLASENSKLYLKRSHLTDLTVLRTAANVLSKRLQLIKST